jgi:hypothetical protein
MSSKDSVSVVPVNVGTAQIGHVFGVAGNFYFLLDDSRDSPRGPFASEDDAAHACENQARCISLAERWELMLDT